MGVAGWNVAAKDAIEVEATENAIRAELSDNDISGSSILQQAFGERQERIVHTAPLADEEARGIAAARYCERARHFVTGTGITDGDARIRVGSVVKLEGLGNLFNGNYYVSRVRHSYDGIYGYRTQFDIGIFQYFVKPVDGVRLFFDQSRPVKRERLSDASAPGILGRDVPGE